MYIEHLDLCMYFTAVCDDVKLGPYEVRIPSGTSTVKSAINVTDDDFYEGDELFNLVINKVFVDGVDGVDRGIPFRSTATIRDDEESKQFLLSNLYCCLHFISTV